MYGFVPMLRVLPCHRSAQEPLLENGLKSRVSEETGGVYDERVQGSERQARIRTTPTMFNAGASVGTQRGVGAPGVLKSWRVVRNGVF